MKINSKSILEKVDYYIDLLVEEKEPEKNEITSGKDPKCVKKQIDDIEDENLGEGIDETFEILNDEDEDLKD